MAMTTMHLELEPRPHSWRQRNLGLNMLKVIRPKVFHINARADILAATDVHQDDVEQYADLVTCIGRLQLAAVRPGAGANAGLRSESSVWCAQQ